MKTITGIAVVLILFIIYAYAPINELKVENPHESNIEVYAIHELEIKPNIDLKEFETFVLEEIAPIYNKMKGQKLILVKGDRGIRTGKYSIVLTFASIEDRNSIYLPSGDYVGDFGDQSIWDKFDSMVTEGIGKAHTDYVKVVQ